MSSKRQEDEEDHVPLSIDVEPSSLISPLKSPKLMHKSSSSMPSLAMTVEGSSSLALSTHHSVSWSTSSSSDSANDSSNDDDNNNNALQQQQQQQAALLASCSGKTIPPRPDNSRWTEEDFYKVIRVWDLSQDEINKMRELEEKLSDVTHWKNNPFEVVRFLKGPQGHKPAEKLIRKMVDWRVANHVDSILEDYTPPALLLDYCPSAILHGLDHDGDPIYLERAGATDASALLKRYGHDGLLRHIVWLRELCGRGTWIHNHEERMGRPITQVTIVYDLAGLNARHLRSGVLPFFAAMMNLMQGMYYNN